MFIQLPGPCARKFRPCSDPRQVFEPLETRALLSAAIQLTGNSQIIANKDNSPSTADFTDFRFMSTTPDAALGTVHRTFTITNTGDAMLTLTGAGPVTLSGPGARDFSVAVQPSTAIDPAASSAFTINFVPTAAGARSARVTVHTNDPAHKTFTFAITGRGVVTINNSANHLQYASVGQINTHLSSNSLKGLPSAFFDDVGVLTDGTIVFDSRANPQGVIPQLELDANGNVDGTILNNGTANNTIAGFPPALQGIQIGETRDMVVPSDLAFGNDTSSGVVAGQTILFEVTCRPPTLVVQGKPTTSALRIAPGDNTPSADDGTLLGTISQDATLSTLTASFALSNGGNGTLSLAASNPLSISGKDAKSFTASFLGTDAGFTGFQVVYHPTTPGTHSAVVNIRSSDPLHPAFSFTLKGTLDGWHDLAVALGAVNFPAAGAVAVGATAKYKFPIIVTNTGNLAIESNAQPLDVELFLHNTSTDSLIAISPADLTSTVFRRLAAGKSRTLTLSLPIPQGIAPGTYDLRAKVDDQNSLQETTLANNTATSSQMITIF